MSNIYRRPELAGQMTQRLLNPGPLDVALQSGLFLSGQRRIGKTTFLLNDLIPCLDAAGAIVIYVDLWSDLQVNPATLVQAAIKRTLKELETPGSFLLDKLKRIKGVDLGALGFKLGFSLDSLGTENGVPLSEALSSVVIAARTDIVLVIDEVQQAITTEEGNKLLTALKAAREAINLTPGMPGRFIFIGTGSHRAKVQELTLLRSQAFQGATTVDYPPLDRDYVQFLLNELNAAGIENIPSLEVAHAGFLTLGQRPEEMIKALRQVVALGPNNKPDEQFPVIAATLRSSSASVELYKLEAMGSLAVAIFDRIAEAGGSAKGLYSADAVAAYSVAIHRQVAVEEIQPQINALLAENLIMRSGHGEYSLTDPFVQKVWLEQKALSRFC